MPAERAIEQAEPVAYDGDLPAEDGFVHRVEERCPGRQRTVHNGG